MDFSIHKRWKYSDFYWIVLGFVTFSNLVKLALFIYHLQQFFKVVIKHNIKRAILTLLSVQFGSVKYIYIVGQSLFRALFFS